MSLDPFALFVERDEVIKAFERLVTVKPPARILAVSGLSGTGKSILIDWFRQKYSAIPMAKLTLAPSFQETDLLRALTTQLDPHVGRVFAEKLDELARLEQEHPLFNVPINQRVEGRLGASVSGADQSVVINLGAAAATIELQRRIQRMDALISSLAAISGNPWVLFLDETEHLVQPDLRRFILDDLIPRLRTQCPNCRLYLSGQSVPIEAFSRHELERLQLGEFTEAETTAMAAKAGFIDPVQARRVYNQTGGHPLLVSMWLEDALDHKESTGEFQFAELSDPEGEAEQTRWIYERIVSRFTDPVAQKVAANLSLLEWFDLGLLRSIFDPSFPEAAFQQMVSRSFIKPLGGNRWRCHDMVRKYLPEQRRRLDPEGSVDVLRRAAEAFFNRMKQEEERLGSTHFPERLTYATAVTQSILGFSVKRAEEFIREELALAAAEGTVDYLFALARYLERSADTATFEALVQQIRDLLEAVTVMRVDVPSIDFLEQLARFSVKRQKPEVAASLFRYASSFSMGVGDRKRAGTLAREAYKLDDNVENAILLARCLTRAGDTGEANQIIETARDKYGDSPELRMGEVKIARDSGDRKQAARLLTELMTVYPDTSVAALIQLTELAAEDNDLAGALKQIEAVLQLEPDHTLARRMQADILFAQGKVAQGLDAIQRLGDTSGDLISAAVRLLGDFSQPAVRNRLIAQFKSDPKSVNPAELLVVVDTLALEGDLKEVEALTAEIQRQWPETAEIISIKRALAYMKAGQPEAVPSLLQPLADRRVFNIDLYGVLADAYGKIGKIAEERVTLEKAIEAIPGARDLLESWLLTAIARVDQPKAALKFLESRAGSSPGPNTLLVKAQLLKQAGYDSAAIDLLDQLIYTQDTNSLPVPSLVSARITYASMLAAKDRDKAFEVLDNTVDLFADSPLAITAAAEIYFRLQDEQRLRRTLERSRDPRPSTRMKLTNLLGLLIADRLRDVQKILAELKAHPDRLELIGALDFVVANSEQSKVSEVFSEAERVAPGLTAEFIVLRNRALEDSGPVIQQLRDAVQANPTQIGLRIGLADALRVHDMLEEAISVIDTFPNPTRDQLVLLTSWKARALVQSDRLDEAETLLGPHMAEQPVPPAELVEVIGELLGRRGKKDEEISLYRRLAEFNPLVRVGSMTLVIQMLVEQNKPAEALQEIEDLAAKEALPISIQFLKIDALEALERFDDAMNYMDTISELERASKLYRARLWTERAYIHRRQQRNEEAIAAARKALEIDPDAIPARHQLSRAYEAVGKIKLAYETLLDAIALQPALAVDYSDRLRKLRELMDPEKSKAEGGGGGN